jgi:hypothetical protein
MKAKKLVVEYEYDFELYGISTNIKGYKLAWLINKFLKLTLARADEYIVELKNEAHEVINYTHVTENSEIRLFKNKMVVQEQKPQSYLVPEMKHFDYFVMVSGIIHTFTSSDLLQELRKIEGLQLINEIDINTLKSRDNFLF